MKNPIAFSLALVLMPILGVEAQDDAQLFLGRWSLHLPGGAGWLEVEDVDGTLDASLLWYGGSVTPVASVNVTGTQLRVTRTRNVEWERPDGSKRQHTITNTLVMRREGDGLAGVAYFPGAQGIGTSTTDFTGERIPDLPAPPDLSQAQYGDPIELFNGTDLTGWSLINPNQTNGFMAEDSVLVNNPVQPEDGSLISYGNLRTDSTFGDFRLTLEVNVPEGSNSGVYLRGIYEIQVADTYGRDSDAHHMGGLYSRIAPSSTVEKPAGEWQTMDITLYQRHLTVILNGTNIIDNQPILGVTGGAMTADESAPGPIFLQGDHGRVLYRNLVLTPILQ